MPDSDNILIEIRSQFEKSGTDAAERAQDNLKRKTEDTNKTFRENERTVNNAQKALAGMTAASQASQGSFGGLSRVLEGFSGRLADVAAKATLVAGAFSAGYGLGTAIDRWLGISKAVADAYAPMEKVASIQDRIRAQLGDLNSASLDAIKTQFDTLNDSLAQTTTQMDKVAATKNALLGAETEAQLAELEASMPAGPARDKAILAKRQERELASIEERRNQARAKFRVQEDNARQAQWAVEPLRKNFHQAKFEEEVAFTLEDKVRARQKVQIAQEALNTAIDRADELKGNAIAEKSNTMRGLAFEERAVRARYTGGLNTITAREQEEAARVAARRQSIREQTENELAQIGANSTRAALSSQLGQLGESREQLSTQGMSSARVADLRAKAAGTYKQADSAVAAVAQVLDSITARMKSLEEKLKNLPR